MPKDAKVNYPNYIYCDDFYDEKYVGVCSGKHQNTYPATKNLAVEVTTHTDQKYKSGICPLHNDGTWKTETYYRETDFYGVDGLETKSITYWYRQDKIINEGGSNGIKGFYLKYYKWLDDEGKEIDVDNLPGSVTKRLAPVPIDPDTGKPMTEHFMYAKTYTLRPVLLDDTIIDDALPRYADYDTSLYVFADVEYLTETQALFMMEKCLHQTCHQIHQNLQLNQNHLSEMQSCSLMIQRANLSLHGLRILQTIVL